MSGEQRNPTFGLRLRRFGVVALAAVAVAACGGDDDSSATTASVTTAITPNTPAPTNPPTTAPPEVVYVTEGAVVVVANASRVDGAASRMTKQLQEVGYTTAEPTGAGATLQRIDTTQIFYAPGDEAAQKVAESLKAAFGGDPITVSELPTPAPTQSGELGEGQNVVAAIGNDVADKTLAQLQGKEEPATESGSTDEDSTSEDSTSEDSTGDGSTGDGESESTDTDDEGTAPDDGDESSTDTGADESAATS